MIENSRLKIDAFPYDFGPEFFRSLRNELKNYILHANCWIIQKLKDFLNYCSLFPDEYLTSCFRPSFTVNCNLNLKGFQIWILYLLLVNTNILIITKILNHFPIKFLYQLMWLRRRIKCSQKQTFGVIQKPPTALHLINVGQFSYFARIDINLSNFQLRSPLGSAENPFRI